MTVGRKVALKQRVILGARQYGISTVLFRSLVADKLGLNVTDMECLALLFHKGLASPTELAQHTGLTSGATTAMLDRLEGSGLIQRRPNPRDRRGILIVLDKSGAEQVAPWFASVRSSQDRLVSRYSEHQLRVIADFFEKSAAMWDDARRQLLHRALRAGSSCTVLCAHEPPTTTRSPPPPGIMEQPPLCRARSQCPVIAAAPLNLQRKPSPYEP